MWPLTQIGPYGAASNDLTHDPCIQGLDCPDLCWVQGCTVFYMLHSSPQYSCRMPDADCPTIMHSHRSHTLHSSIHTPPYLPAWGSVPGRVGSTCVHAVRPLPPPCTSAPAIQRPLPAVAPPQQQPQAALRGSAHAHCADRHPTPSRSCRMKCDMSRDGFSRSDEGEGARLARLGLGLLQSCKFMSTCTRQQLGR